MIRFLYIFLCLYLFGGCGENRNVREQGDKWCYALFRNGLAESDCDSIIRLSLAASPEIRVDVLLEAVRSDVGAYEPHKVEGWLADAARVVPKQRRCEVEMEEFRWRLKREWQNLDTADMEKERKDFAGFESKYRFSSRQKAWFLYHKAIIFSRNDMLDTWTWMREALRLARRENLPMLEVRILERFANIAVWGGDYDLGVSYWREAYEIRKSKGMYADSWSYWVWQESCFFRIKRYTEALSCWRELLKEPGVADDDEVVVKVYYGMLKVFRAMENYTESLELLRKLEKMEKRLSGRAGVWKDMAEIFDLQERRDSSAVYYRKTVEFWEEKMSGRMLYALYPAYAGYARVLWNEGERAEAVRLLEKAVADIPRFCVSEDLPNGGIYLQPYLDIVMQLSGYYRTLGNTIPAIGMLLRRDSLKDKYAESDMWYKNMELTERYRNQDLKVRISWQEEQLKTRKYIIAGVVMLCVALAGIILMLWKLYRQKQHRLDEIYQKQKELERLEYQITSPVTETPETLLFQRLENLVLKEQLFRNPELSLEEVCTLVGSNRSYVSGCVNKCVNMNFSAWINKIRIDYVLKSIRAGEQDLTDLQVNAGFASPTSFYRNFKQVTRMTPKQYLERERKKEIFSF